MLTLEGNIQLLERYYKHKLSQKAWLEVTTYVDELHHVPPPQRLPYDMAKLSTRM